MEDAQKLREQRNLTNILVVRRASQHKHPQSTLYSLVWQNKALTSSRLCPALLMTSGNLNSLSACCCGETQPQKLKMRINPRQHLCIYHHLGYLNLCNNCSGGINNFADKLFLYEFTYNWLKSE